MSGRSKLLAAELQPLSFVFPAPLPCNGQGLIGTMCEPGESPDPQDFSGNNVLKLLLGDGTGVGEGRRERTEVTSYRCSGSSAVSAALVPRPSCWARGRLPWAVCFASQRTISLVLRQVPSEKRHLPLRWYAVLQQRASFPRGSNQRLARIFGQIIGG